MPVAPAFKAEFADLNAVVGEAAARRLLAAFGGRRLYIPAPAALGEAHPIAAVIGMEAAHTFCEYWHGTELYFPVTAARKQRILDLAQAGKTTSAIVMELMVSRRHVQEVLAEARKDDQLKLI